jgi:amino-acid N-acetyltransferase
VVSIVLQPPEGKTLTTAEGRKDSAARLASRAAFGEASPSPGGAAMEDTAFVPAQPSDLPAVVALLSRCGLPTGDLGAAHLTHFTLCKRGEALLGTVGLEPLGDLALLRSLAVAPEARGRGLGHALWERARAAAAGGGAATLYLLTTTAEPLFARWGFRRLERDAAPEAVRATPEFGALCPSSAVLMTLALPPRPTSAPPP